MAGRRGRKQKVEALTQQAAAEPEIIESVWPLHVRWLWIAVSICPECGSSAWQRLHESGRKQARQCRGCGERYTVVATHQEVQHSPEQSAVLIEA